MARRSINQKKPGEFKTEQKIESIDNKAVEIPAVLSVNEFATILQIPVTKVIGTLMKNGVIATINENIDAETAMIIGDELGFNITEKQEETKQTEIAEITKEDASKRISRPPVVTVMGHVDHGKTTLLDAIRKTHVASSESGGITQHIGAYQVPVRTKEGKERIITFLDTPGHEAFSAMRAHGATITDLVILVVAADDGVKPQTVEAINHAHAANVPIIVAINKIDTPGANPERVKEELAKRDLVPEDWGGKTIMVPISAKNGENINDLLEMVLLVADLKNFTTNPEKAATGVVIESKMQVGVGPRATILINDGTLKQGDVVVIGNTWGKIRFMEDYRGKRIKIAYASTPIRIAGIHEVPVSGEPVITVDSEKTARNMTEVKSVIRHHISSNEISGAISESKKEKVLNIILKTDVQGSMEAIRSSLQNLTSADVTIKIINEGVGDISESDINMAETTNAIIIGFRTSLKPQIKQLAERKNVKINIYEIIYQLLDDLYGALSDLLEPEKIEVPLGKLEILQIFRSGKSEQIVGGRIIDGKITAGCECRINREKEQIAEGSIISLHRGEEAVDSLPSGTECGLRIKTPEKLLEKDIVEAYQIEERIRTLEKK